MSESPFSNHRLYPTVNSPIFIYGPPGSGKSSIGRLLAEELNLPFYDLDMIVEAQAGETIPEIFSAEGEAGFRRREGEALKVVLASSPGVVSLGGGSLLDADRRARVEAAGVVVCLAAPLQVLVDRLQAAADRRPLLSGDLRGRLVGLLAERGGHYASFPVQIDSSGPFAEAAAWETQIRLGKFHVRGMGQGYDVRVLPGGLGLLGEALRAAPGAPGFSSIAALVSDENVGEIYAGPAAESLSRAGFSTRTVLIPAGEQHKTIDTVVRLWDAFLQAGVERGGPIVALGGGVVGDLTGFAAAAFLRGVPWIAAPTSLLAMVDASLGGKTGADLPQGKNLIGAFHPPRLVLADPQALTSLPESELRSGVAEVVKAGIIGDPALFELCTRGWDALEADLGEVVRRTMAVKIAIIEADPYEKGLRAALNLGHTFGHAIETVSGYRLRHGEAVSIGMVLAARLSERLGLAESGLAERIELTLSRLGLPVKIPAGIDLGAVDAAMRVDKKRSQGITRFVLPKKIGKVEVGVEVGDWSIGD